MIRDNLMILIALVVIGYPRRQVSGMMHAPVLCLFYFLRESKRHELTVICRCHSCGYY